MTACCKIQFCFMFKIFHSKLVGVGGNRGISPSFGSESCCLSSKPKLHSKLGKT